MPKVEVDLPELPCGYVYTGEYRKAHRGDEYVIFSLGGDDPGIKVTSIQTWKSHVLSLSAYPIVKKLWQPPEGIYTPGWLAVDADGTVGWYAEQPMFWSDEGDWEVNSNAKNNSMRYLRLPATSQSDCLRDDLLPPANLRGPMAIWQVG